MVSCFDGERVKSFVIEVPPFTLAEIRRRKFLIERRTALPADCEPGCFDDWGCPFRYLHVKPEVVDNEAVDKLVLKYERSGFLIKEMKENQAEAKAELEKLMVFDDRIETESSIVTKFKAANPPKWDEDAMRADGIDVAKYKKQVEGDRMKITRKRVDTVTPDVVVSTDTTEGETDDHDQRAGS
jgi:nucleoside diphosphate kinase